MKIPEEYKWAYEKAELSKDRPTLFTGAAFMRLIERIATLTEQLHKCAVAARSCEEAVAIGEPFGDEVKAVLTLRQNADAGFAELAQARAELDSERAIVDRIWAIFGTPSYEELAGKSIYDLINGVIAERDSLRAQLEQMRKADRFSNNQNHCGGYNAGCDGDLVGMPHEKGCPARKLDMELRPHLYVPPPPEVSNG